MRRLDSEKYDRRMCVPRLQGGGGSVGIWGCFSLNGTGVSSIQVASINMHIWRSLTSV